MMDRDAKTAKSYAYAAVIAQAVLFVVGAFLLSVALVYWIWGVDIGLFGALGMAGMVSQITLVLTLGQTLYLIAAYALTASVGWLIADYYMVYRRLRQERVMAAEHPSLYLGIAQTIVGGTVAGILLLVAYMKIRSSEVKARRAQPAV